MQRDDTSTTRHGLRADRAGPACGEAPSAGQPARDRVLSQAAGVTPDTHTSAGIAIAVLSALFTGTGTVVEKIALQRLPDVHARQFWAMIRTLCSSSQWLWGCMLLLGGLVCQGLALVVGTDLCGTADLRFRDRPSPRAVTSRAARPPAAGGVVRSGDDRGRFGPARSVGRHPRVDRAGATANLPDFLLAAIPTAAVGLAVFVVADRAHSSAQRFRQLRAPLFGMAAGLLYGVAGLGLKSASTYVQRWGLFGSVPHLLVSPDLYLLAVAMGTGLVLFQTGLQRCSASVVSPVNIVTSTAYVIAVGTVLFHEHLPTSAGPLGLRLAGFAGVVAGLVTLAAAGGKSENLPAGPEQALNPPAGSDQLKLNL